MWKKRGRPGVGLWIFTMMGFFALAIDCGDLQAASKAEEVRVGAIFPLSGPAAEIGKHCKEAVDLGVKIINDSGGIKNLGGAKVRVIFADNRSIPDASASESERLILREGVHILTGAYNSGPSAPIGDVAERRKTPWVVAGTSSDNITGKGYKFTFREAVQVKQVKPVATQIMLEIFKQNGDSIKRAAITYEDSDWGQDGSKTQKRIFEEKGVNVVLNEGYPADAPDLTPLVIKLKAANPDLFIPHCTIQDAIQLTKLMKTYQITPKLIFAAGGAFTDSSYLQAVGSLGDYICTTTIWNDIMALTNPHAKVIGDLYRKTHGRSMTEPAAFTYYAFQVMVDALERTKSLDKEDLRIALANTDLKAGDTAAPYPTKFGPDGQNTEAALIAVQYVKGKPEVIWPSRFMRPDAKVAWPFPAWDKR